MDLVQLIGADAGQATVAARIEAAIADGSLEPGARLAPVRELAASLGVSPATVAAAYRTLKQRGLVTADGRRGTTVTGQPPLRIRAVTPVPSGARDLARGNPDPALLPSLGDALARIDPAHRLYGDDAKHPQLVELARDVFRADGIEGEIAIVGGALDGVERALQTRLRPGDRVALEDPSWPRIADLVNALGLVPVPVAVDDEGIAPDALDRALRRGVRALIAVPRAQNPTGAALTPTRARRLRELLARHPDVLVVEDDYVWAVAGAPYITLHGATPRWVVIRSLSKVLGPDLRIALVAGDALTISRIEGRQLLGPGWVSHLLQQAAAELLGASSTKRLLARAERTYARRRGALVDALTKHGIPAHSRSGLSVWIPVHDEATAAQALLERGWAVSAGERYRFDSRPGIRVTVTTLEPAEAKEVAAALAEATRAGASTYPG